MIDSGPVRHRSARARRGHRRDHRPRRARLDAVAQLTTQAIDQRGVVCARVYYMQPPQAVRCRGLGAIPATRGFVVGIFSALIFAFPSMVGGGLIFGTVGLIACLLASIATGITATQIHNAIGMPSLGRVIVATFVGLVAGVATFSIAVLAIVLLPAIF
jgi:hypothetical protein